MSQSEIWPPTGAVICGKYRIERLIGRGGMGIVMLAHHLRLDEDVALKFLTPQAMLKPDVRARFEREARAIVKLKSEHVTRVLDVEVADNGTPFMVMEYLEGQTLAGLVRNGAALPTDLAAEYILQACEAVAEAHALGIIHRDLKPGNLFLTTDADGSALVKVLDFGVSKLSGGLGPQSGADVETLPDAIVGSPPYMSPEQLRSSKDVDTRTDIWSLGVVLFEIVTGRMPFAAQNLHEHYTKLMLDPPPLPTQVRADLSPMLDTIVSKCLARDPSDRYPTVAELARDLAKLAPTRALPSVERVERTLSLSRAPRPSRPSLPAPPIALPPSIHTIDRTRIARPRRSRIILIATALATFTLFAAVWRTTHTPTQTQTQTQTRTPTPTPTLTPTPTPSASVPVSVFVPVSVSVPVSASVSVSAPAIRVRPRPTVNPSALPSVDLEHRK